MGWEQEKFVYICWHDMNTHMNTHHVLYRTEVTTVMKQ